MMIFVVYKGEAVTVDAFSLLVNLFKLFVLPQQACFWKPLFFQQYYAERRLRPRARRALIMARPARVRIRARNPWARFRLILLG